MHFACLTISSSSQAPTMNTDPRRKFSILRSRRKTAKRSLPAVVSVRAESTLVSYGNERVVAISSFPKCRASTVVHESWNRVCQEMERILHPASSSSPSSPSSFVRLSDFNWAWENFGRESRLLDS